MFDPYHNTFLIMSNYNTFSVLDSDDEDSRPVIRTKTSDNTKKTNKKQQKSSSSSSVSQQPSNETSAPARRNDRKDRRKGDGNSRRQDTGNGRDSRGKRVKDRRSGTGRAPGAAKRGGGRANWGNMDDELKMVEGEGQGPNAHPSDAQEGEVESKQEVVEEVEEDPNMTVEQFMASKAKVSTRSARQVDSSQMEGMSRVTSKKEVSEESKTSSSSRTGKKASDDGTQQAYAMFGFSKHHGSSNSHYGERRNNGDRRNNGERRNRRVNTQDNREFPSLRA